MKKIIVLFSFFFAVATISLHAQTTATQSNTTQATAAQAAAPAKGECTKAQCSKSGQCSHSKTASKDAKYECKACGYTSNKPGKCACGATLTKVAVNNNTKSGTSTKM